MALEETKILVKLLWQSGTHWLAVIVVYERVWVRRAHSRDALETLIIHGVYDATQALNLDMKPTRDEISQADFMIFGPGSNIGRDKQNLLNVIFDVYPENQ